MSKEEKIQRRKELDYMSENNNYAVDESEIGSDWD